MPSTTDISPLSITDGKISNEAKIAHAKLAKAVEGQVLVAQSDGKFAAKTLAGDVTLAADGSTTSNVAVASDGTTVVAGPAGAKGDKGDTGNQGVTGATGPAGSDATVTEATVNAAGAVMHADFGSEGFIKRGSSSASYTIDNSTYSTTGHTHAHADLTGIDADQHRVINDGGTSSTELWSANNINYHLGGKAASGHLHTGVYSATGHTHDLSDITDSGTAAPLDVPASGNASSSQVVKGNDTRLTDARTPSSTLAHKASHEYGGTDALSPSDIGAAATGHTHDSRYFQESEFINASAGVGDAGKPVKLDDDGKIDEGFLEGVLTYNNLADIPSTFTPSSHTHSYSSLTGIPSTFSATINDFGTSGSDVWSASKIISNGVVTAKANAPVKHFTIDLIWGDSTQSGVDYPSGTDPVYDGIVDITHGLTTNYVVCSIVDQEGKLKPAMTQLDLNFEDEVLVKIINNNKVRITFGHISAELGGSQIDEGDGFYITIMGAV